MRGEQLSRQWRILCRIETSRSGLTAGEIARMAGSSLRTAYRDLADLQLAGFPLYTEKEDKAQRWKLVEAYRVRLPQPVTLTELLSLQLSRDLFRVLEGAEFYDSLNGFFTKITAALPPESIGFLERVRDAFQMGSRRHKDYGRHREIVCRLNQAVLQRHSLEIAYQGLSDTAPVLRRIDPYKIWFYDGALYIIGLCHLRSQIRTFVLDRIKMLRVTGQPFDPPVDFDFGKFIRHSFKVMQGELYTVVIQISPTWARYVGERMWHESHTIQNLFDGGIEITLRVAGLDEIKQWVMSMGPEAYIVAPEELRSLVRAELENTLSQYRTATTLAEPDKKVTVGRNPYSRAGK